MGGVNLKGEGALLAKGSQEDVAALDDFLGGYVMEHLARGFGTFAEELAQFGLADHGEEYEMTMR